MGRSKTEAGEGRTIPLKSAVLPVLADHVGWYKAKFGTFRPEWYARRQMTVHPISFMN